MAIAPRLDQRQSQSLVMTPQLQQAIKLLQMSNLELAEYIEQELEKNPLLEQDEGDRHGIDAEPDEVIQKNPDERNDAESQVAPEVDNLESIDFDAQVGDVDIPDEAGYDVDYDNIYNNTGGDGAEAHGASSSLSGLGNGSSSYDGDLPSLEETLSEQPTLHEHLTAQLHDIIHDPVDQVISKHLIGLLDESGYLTGELTEVADLLSCPVERVEQTLFLLQQLEPTGIFARNLSECLALQLREQDRYDPAMAALVDNLELVAKREYTALCKLCGVDMDDVVDMVDEIRCLNPRPSADFIYEIVQAVTPDVMMRPQSGGGWYLELNNDNLPRVLVNNHYFSQVSKATVKKDERDYIAEQLQSANWLVKAMHQRATTILKVATEVVRQQEAFFRLGVQHLRPLVLRDIADVIEMHESTVSRVTSNKYIATPRGIYELKYFFTSSIGSTTGGDSHSAESVRQKIKELIDAEAPTKILSDDKLMAILKTDGFDVARRTVAKYRESLGLGSSVQRRREKSAPK